MKKEKKIDKIKILVSGSRDWDWQTVFDKAMVNVLSEIQYSNITAIGNFEIIHGGARGVDTMAGNFANKFGIPVKVFYADWDNMRTDRVSVGTTKGGADYNKLAGFNRNLQMLEYANTFDKSVNGIAKCFLIAFQQNKSKGTQHTIAGARDFKMPTYYFTVKYGVQLELRTLGFESTLKYVRF